MTIKTISIDVLDTTMPGGTPGVDAIQVVLKQPDGTVVEQQNLQPVNPLSVTFNRAPGDYVVEAYGIQLPSGKQVGPKVTATFTILADVVRSIPSAIHV